MSISTWCFLLLLKREMADAKLASVLKQMKGSVTEIPTAGIAKTLLLSCNWTNWSAFLYIYEELNGHKNVPKSTFCKGIFTSKVCLSRLTPGRTAKMEISHPGNAAEGIQFCSVLFDNTSVQETPKLPGSGYPKSAAMLRSFLRINATYSNSCQVLRISKFQNFSLCMISSVTDHLPPSYISPDLLSIHKIARPHVVL